MIPNLAPNWTIQIRAWHPLRNWISWWCFTWSSLKCQAFPRMGCQDTSMNDFYASSAENTPTATRPIRKQPLHGTKVILQSLMTSRRWLTPWLVWRRAHPRTFHWLGWCDSLKSTNPPISGISMWLWGPTMFGIQWNANRARMSTPTHICKSWWSLCNFWIPTLVHTAKNAKTWSRKPKHTSTQLPKCGKWF